MSVIRACHHPGLSSLVVYCRTRAHAILTPEAIRVRLYQGRFTEECTLSEWRAASRSERVLLPVDHGLYCNRSKNGCKTLPIKHLCTAEQPRKRPVLL